MQLPCSPSPPPPPPPPPHTHTTTTTTPTHLPCSSTQLASFFSKSSSRAATCARSAVSTSPPSAAASLALSASCSACAACHAASFRSSAFLSCSCSPAASALLSCCAGTRRTFAALASCTEESAGQLNEVGLRNGNGLRTAPTPVQQAARQARPLVYHNRGARLQSSSYIAPVHDSWPAPACRHPMPGPCPCAPAAARAARVPVVQLERTG